MSVVTEQGYRGPAACKIVGISYRQLDYWTRSGLVTPSISEGVGSGSQRLYSFDDLLRLRIVKELVDAGVSLQRVRIEITYLQERLGDKWDGAVIVTDLSGMTVCTGDDELVEFIREGVGVPNVVPVAKIRDRLTEAVASWMAG